jgi:hypothetical protein
VLGKIIYTSMGVHINPVQYVRSTTVLLLNFVLSTSTRRR